jgi:hypothetical protein
MTTWILRGKEDKTNDQMGRLWFYIDFANGNTTNESGGGYGVGNTWDAATGGIGISSDNYQLWDGSGSGKGTKPERHPER